MIMQDYVLEGKKKKKLSRRKGKCSIQTMIE